MLEGSDDRDKDRRRADDLTASLDASRPIRPSTECASSSQCQISKGHRPTAAKRLSTPLPQRHRPTARSPLKRLLKGTKLINLIGKDQDLGSPALSKRSIAAAPATKTGGARRDRTDDLMLAKHALSQLSYGPFRGRMTDARRQINDLSVVCPPSSVVR